VKNYREGLFGSNKTEASESQESVCSAEDRFRLNQIIWKTSDINKYRVNDVYDDDKNLVTV